MALFFCLVAVGMLLWNLRLAAEKRNQDGWRQLERRDRGPRVVP